MLLELTHIRIQLTKKEGTIMKCVIRLLKMFIVIVLFYSIFPQMVYAYLDPGTGSYIFQLLIASLVGGLFAVKVFWKDIKNFIKKIFSKGRNSNGSKNEKHIG